MLEQGAIFLPPHKCGCKKIAKILYEGAFPLVLPGCSVNIALRRRREHRCGSVSFARRQKIAKIPYEGACPLVLPGCSVNIALRRRREHRRGSVSFARRQKIAKIPYEGFPRFFFFGLHNHTASHTSAPFAMRQPANTLRSATFQMMRRKKGMTACGRYT